MEKKANNIAISRADMAKDVNVRIGMAKIFGEGFTQWLGFFSKDQDKIAKAFAHIFVLDQFYVAVVGDEVAGMVACTDCMTLSVCLDKKELRKHFGLYKGFLAGIFLKKEFEKPFRNPPLNTGSIEFVGTSSNFRGQGISLKIFDYIFENTPFVDYIIEEVADTNVPAMALYQKMGFVEYKSSSVPVKKATKIGINKFISLKLTKPEC
ncbi:GNAT family N-acetyltransferase [Faecalicatena contorta]|uniref:Acetyltransferase (GNAT) family protein n=1 Tax=Faecalicatena contorta TaxID=39482 RepID=A0A316A2F8_9FIRM|nr:GNAT family N-acetyltransferase [Faecalicatena contorta]PWJ52041.1 acetyltransferase (GNAT) family protein [Faecalicatena contorta]SUQ12319.1 Acetyltransferase (GNAT) family protein [Faecalicatena contorta]